MKAGAHVIRFVSFLSLCTHLKKWKNHARVAEPLFDDVRYSEL